MKRNKIFYTDTEILINKLNKSRVDYTFLLYGQLGRRQQIIDQKPNQRPP